MSKTMDEGICYQVRWRTCLINNPSFTYLFNQDTSRKLDKGNFLFSRQSIILPILKSYKLEGHLTRSTPYPYHSIVIPPCEDEPKGLLLCNLEYDIWIVANQLLIGRLQLDDTQNGWLSYGDMMKQNLCGMIFRSTLEFNPNLRKIIIDNFFNKLAKVWWECLTICLQWKLILVIYNLLDILRTWDVLFPMLLVDLWCWIHPNNMCYKKPRTLLEQDIV